MQNKGKEIYIQFMSYKSLNHNKKRSENLQESINFGIIHPFSTRTRIFLDCLLWYKNHFGFNSTLKGFAFG